MRVETFELCEGDLLARRDAQKVTSDEADLVDPELIHSAVAHSYQVVITASHGPAVSAGPTPDAHQ